MKNQPKTVENISEEKALFLTELNQAVSELNQVLAGRFPAQDADELLNELGYPEPNCPAS